jgi:UDP-glucuronate 4-epimerase
VALDVVAAEVPGFSWRDVPAGEAAVVRQVAAQARAAMDVTRLVRDTPWRPRYPLAEGVRAYLAWRRDHPDVVALAEASD